MSIRQPSLVRLRSASLCGLVCLLLSGAPASAVEPDKFLVRTTADLVALCAADPNQENYVAALHFCHGFASGAYQFYSTIAAAIPNERFVCPPNPPPTRTAAINEFVAWTKQNPNFDSAPPVDSMFRFLGTRYPCAPGTASR